MLHQSIQAFLGQARLGALVTVGEELRPTVHRCTGFRINGDRLTMVVGDTRQLDLAAVLAARPRIAVVIGAVDRFAAFQLKGDATARRATPDEIARAATDAVEVGALVEQVLRVPADRYRSLLFDRAWLVELTAQEAYEQSPGPGAGNLLGRNA